MSRWSKAALATIENAYRLERTTAEWLAGLIEKPLLSGADHTFSLEFAHEERGFVVLESAGMSELFRAHTEELEERFGPGQRERLWPRSGDGPLVVFTERVPRSLERVYDGLAAWGIAEVVSILCEGPGTTGCSVNHFFGKPVSVDRTLRRRLERVGAHVGAALRLRAGAHAEEAVLGVDGRVLHAEPAAVTHRDALRRAAVRVDRARARGRQDPDGAIGAWRALVEGRWSLVERFDSDGRRLYIARVNPPEAVPLHALTDRERQVVGRVARGHSLKLVAYELGLAESTISMAVKSAIRKLGVRRRAELIQLVASLGVSGRPARDG